MKKFPKAGAFGGDKLGRITNLLNAMEEASANPSKFQQKYPKNQENTEKMGKSKTLFLRIFFSLFFHSARIPHEILCQFRRFICREKLF